VVPYLLGFHPRRSLVVLCLRGRRLGLVQRMDLPNPEDAGVAVGSLLPSLEAEAPDAVVLLGYEDAPGAAEPAVAALTNELAPRGVSVRDRIVVTADRWRSLDCPDLTCCPVEGTPLPAAVDAAAVVAELVGRGVAPHADRAALAAELEPGPAVVPVGDVVGALCAAREAQGRAAAVPRADLLTAWARVLNPSAGDITDRDVALAAVALHDLALRDGVLAWLCPGVTDPDVVPCDLREALDGLQRPWDAGDRSSTGPAAANRMQARLVGLCARLRDADAAPALAVLATFAWWRGNGALARIALTRARRCDPSYPLTRLLDALVTHAIRIDPH
jgi:hypothetical protein